jgi:DNA-directed RNA polymerase II subunit RPB2
MFQTQYAVDELETELESVEMMSIFQPTPFNLDDCRIGDAGEEGVKLSNCGDFKLDILTDWKEPLSYLAKPMNEEEEEDKDEEGLIEKRKIHHQLQPQHQMDYIEEPWDLINAYFCPDHTEKLVQHQLSSYNNFVGLQLEKTINMFNPVRIASDQDLDKVSGRHALEILLTFDNLHIHRPQIHENNGAVKAMFPQEARLRNFTYSSSMMIDVNVQYNIRSGENLQNLECVHKKFSKIQIGKLPIMLKSNICLLSQYKHFDAQKTGECEYDVGGYFIVNGSEKTVLAQERAAENRIYVYDISKKQPKYTFQAEIKSIPDNKCISPKQIIIMISSKHNGFGHPLMVQIPRVKKPLPLFQVFRALGVISDKDICSKILLNVEHPFYKPMFEFLQGSVVDANHHLTQEESIANLTSYVAFTPMNMDRETGLQKKREFAMEILTNDLFPHCATPEQKIYFLGYMTFRLLRVQFELAKTDDRDSYLNKRIDLTGTLLNNQVRNHFNKVVKDAEKQTIKEINNGSWRSTDDYSNIINTTNIYKIIKSTTIETNLKRSLSTGDFSSKQGGAQKVGVAQVLNRLTYVSSLSHLRRLSTPTDKSGKLVPPRKLHNTTWGFICPAETPEGQSVGIVKNLSTMTHITINTTSLPMYDYVQPYLIELKDAADIEMFNMVKVFVNGAWIGVTRQPLDLYRELKQKKYSGILNIYCSVIFDCAMKEIRVCNDAGRLSRPVLRVRDNKLLLTKEIAHRVRNKELTWEDLLMNTKIEESVIEYIDPEEQSFSLIAMSPVELATAGKLKRYTHCEIHPSTIFGILGSCIPFPDHNQSPRNCYQCAQGKQAMGIYATNFDARMDKTAYILNYPSKPLVDTRIMGILKLNKIPSGQNIVVAIMSHTGYNQEDSVLVNKASIDRGLFLATIYHTEKDEDKQQLNGSDEIRCKPDPQKTKGMKFANYNKVNALGFVPENTLIENRDVILSKVALIKGNRNDHTKIVKYEDQSKIFKTFENTTYIDKNYTDRNGDGYTFAKVRTRTIRKPVIGDKFSSRHGQKGTTGNIIPECDMPYTKDGVKPDIIINPHAIPSRMTIGQLKETVLGKVLTQLGMCGDGTPFTSLDIHTICQKLQEQGFDSSGNEIMYNGMTGEQMECSVFIGPVFYQRLKHMVNDKAHSRSVGPMVRLTRQPAEGRSRDGGFRFGEMERDCMISHGASRFTRDRMYNSSDKYSVHVCNNCGMIAAFNDHNHIHLCLACKNMTDFSKVEIPYTCKLLFQELATMCINPRIITDKHKVVRQVTNAALHNLEIR